MTTYRNLENSMICCYRVRLCHFKMVIKSAAFTVTGHVLVNDDTPEISYSVHSIYIPAVSKSQRDRVGPKSGICHQVIRRKTEVRCSVDSIRRSLEFTNSIKITSITCHGMLTSSRRRSTISILRDSFQLMNCRGLILFLFPQKKE